MPVPLPLPRSYRTAFLMFRSSRKTQVSAISEQIRNRHLELPSGQSRNLVDIAVTQLYIVSQSVLGIKVVYLIQFDRIDTFIDPIRVLLHFFFTPSTLPSIDWFRYSINVEKGKLYFNTFHLISVNTTCHAFFSFSCIFFMCHWQCHEGIHVDSSSIWCRETSLQSRATAFKTVACHSSCNLRKFSSSSSRFLNDFMPFPCLYEQTPAIISS